MVPALILRWLKAGFVAVSLLASSGVQAQTTEVSFYYPVAVGGPVTRIIDGLVAEFEKSHPDIKIRPTYSGTYQESIAKALTAHKSGNPPVMAVLFAVDIYTLLGANAVVAFDDLLSNDIDRAWLDSFYPAFMANSRTAGKTWGIPFQRSTILLYWNKELFKEAGLDPAHPPASWQEMQDYAQKLTRRDSVGMVTQWGLQIPASGFPYWLFQGLTTANGVELMNAKGTETYFDRPEVIQALQYWVDLSRQSKVHPPGIVEWGATPTDFLKKKAAMIWTTSGNLTRLKKDASFDLGVTMLPANKRRGSPTGGGNFYIFKKSSPQQQQAAFKFIRWISSPERSAQWGIATGYVAVQPDAWSTPAMKSHAANFPYATVGRDQLQYSVAEFSTHENQRVTQVLNNGLVAALTGAKTAEQAMKDAQAEAVRILRPYQR